MRDLWRRLYSGDNDVDFLGARKVVAIVTAVATVIFGISLVTRGLDLGIEFEGGIVWEVPRGEGVDTGDIGDALLATGVDDPGVQTVSSISGDLFRVSGSTDDVALRDEVADALAEANGVDRDAVSLEEVGPSWGEEITSSALNALLWFLGLIFVYVTVRFEWRMAVAALVAVFHDVFISVGLYSLIGFEVTPATVIAFLTILGYSLYDTIVVFDKVNDNVALMSARGDETYATVVNRSLNQVIMRSINTTLTSLLPVVSMLMVGALLLGATALSEFALALLIGMLSGAYSSIFVAAPVLVALRMGVSVPRRTVSTRRSAPTGAGGRTASVGRAGRTDEPIAVQRPVAGGSAPRPRRRPRRS